MYVVGRLRPGVTVDAARAEMRTIAEGLARIHPENQRVGVSIIRLRDAVSTRARLMLLALMMAAAGVLLIACTNLANLLLARALVRRKELALRTALGAGRERLVRQLLTESLLLASAGGVLGVWLAMSGVPLLTRLVPTSLPITEVPPLDLRVMLLGALLTVLTGIGFGVLPAMRACGGLEAAALQEGSRGGVGGRRQKLRHALVIAAVAVSVMLSIGSGLLIRALWRVQSTPPGFRPEGVLTLRTWLPLPKYDQTARRMAFYNRVLADVRALPGVKSAAYISFLPMTVRGGVFPVTLEGRASETERARAREPALRDARLLRHDRHAASDGTRRQRLGRLSDVREPESAVRGGRQRILRAAVFSLVRIRSAAASTSPSAIAPSSASSATSR